MQKQALVRTPLAVLLTTLLTGCFSLAPDYERPVAPVAQTWEHVPAVPEGTQAADEMPWRTFFTEIRLQQVIGMALDNNRDLRVTVLNIEKARAQYQIQRADLFPTITANGSGSAQRLPDDLSGTGSSMIVRQYSATLGFSAYELDFFGRVRSLRDAALERYLATEEAQRSARISLVAEVATTWLQLAADQERLKLAYDTQQALKTSYELIQRRYELGTASALDALQAKTAFEEARANVARYTALVDQDRNALVLVVGAAVPDILLPDGLSAVPNTLQDFPVGMPSEVLVRRPDIVQAERSLRAANANIGAARAAFFPSITLTGGVGTASASLDDLFKSGSGTWNFMPQISLPIFDAGRLSANLDVAKVERDISIAQYDKAIQQAFREVADVLAERRTLTDRLDAQMIRAEASSDAYKLADARYRSGVDNYLRVLDAQRTLYAAQGDLIDASFSKTVNSVTFYKVLGGGWQ